MQKILVPRFTWTRLKRLSLMTFGVAGLLLLLPRTPMAEVIYKTGFEAPIFTAGQPVAGQDGWTSRLGSNAGTVSTNNPASGQQALEFRGEQLPEFGFGFNLETVRKFLDYNVAAAGAHAVRVGVDVRLNGASLRDDVVEAIFSAIDPNFVDYGQMQISANGRLYIYGSQFVDALDIAVSLNAYHRLEMLIDFAGRETTFTVDGADIVTFAFDPSLQSTVFRAGSLHMAVPTDPLLADPTGYAAYFDNLQVEAIPEPAAWALMVAGLLMLSHVRRSLARRA